MNIMNRARKVAAWAIVSGFALLVVGVIAWRFHEAFGLFGALAVLGVPPLFLLLRWAMKEIDGG